MNKKAFTLVEILIVVSIIGVLTGVMLRVMNVESLNQKARDSQRVSDAKKIQTALELYFVDNRLYPSSNGNYITITGTDALSVALAPNYINAMPKDSKSPTLDYKYNSSDGKTYTITIAKEFESSNECGSNPYSGYGCKSFTNPL